MLSSPLVISEEVTVATPTTLGQRAKEREREREHEGRERESVHGGRPVTPSPCVTTCANITSSRYFVAAPPAHTETLQRKEAESGTEETTAHTRAVYTDRTHTRARTFHARA